MRSLQGKKDINSCLKFQRLVLRIATFIALINLSIIVTKRVQGGGIKDFKNLFTNQDQVSWLCLWLGCSFMIGTCIQHSAFVYRSE